MTDIYMCPACNEKRGMIKETGAGNQVLRVQCTCGYKYVWVHPDFKRVLDAYKQAVAWAYGPEMAKEL